MLKEPGRDVDASAHEVIGAAIEVHRHLGAGYLESVYESALAYELTQRQIPFQRQPPFAVRYKDQMVGEGRMDLLVEQKLIVELKAVEAILPIHKAQVINYLKATDHSLALLINFNVKVLRDGIHRIVLT